jgi:hypothetical protein
MEEVKKKQNKLIQGDIRNFLKRKIDNKCVALETQEKKILMNNENEKEKKLEEGNN